MIELKDTCTNTLFKSIRNIEPIYSPELLSTNMGSIIKLMAKPYTFILEGLLFLLKTLFQIGVPSSTSKVKMGLN